MNEFLPILLTDKFELVSLNNMGTVTTKAVLDRENVSTYSLMVQASVIEATTGGGNGRRRRQATGEET